MDDGSAGPAPAAAGVEAGSDARLRAARRTLCIGIGGGGDVVGALAVAEHARSLGSEAIIGGVTWERRPIDPLPGPRRLDEIVRAEPLNAAVALCRPDTTGPGGFSFAEAHMAAFLGEPTVLVDPHGGPRAVGEGIAGAARRLGCDLVVLVDVGGDVLAHGDEPGLASPLCDSVLLAAAPVMHAAGLPVLAAVFGPGCDGELTPDEVLERLAEVAAAGGLLGATGLTPEVTARLDAAVRLVPTEASAAAIACARGGYGELLIRGGRRRVRLSPLGAVTFHFDPAAAIASAARLAAAVADAASLEDADDRLRALGVRTELAYERDASVASSPRP